jgi:hypothetical protein
MRLERGYIDYDRSRDVSLGWQPVYCSGKHTHAAPALPADVPAVLRRSPLPVRERAVQMRSAASRKAVPGETW